MKRIIRSRPSRTVSQAADLGASRVGARLPAKVLGLSLIFAGLTQAQPLTLEAALVGSGAGVMEAGAFQVELAAGEPVVGRASGAALQVELGLFAAGLSIGVAAEDGAGALAFALHANYPNPFAPSTTISYTLPEAEDVLIEVFDVLGRRVRTLVDAAQGPGRYTVGFHAESLASGVYLCRLTAGAYTATRQMQLIR